LERDDAVVDPRLARSGARQVRPACQTATEVNYPDSPFIK